MAAEASDRGAVANGKYRSVPLQVVDDQVSHPMCHIYLTYEKRRIAYRHTGRVSASRC